MAVNIAVRWADDTKQLAANLREGTDAITATKASVDKLVSSLGGDKLITAAHRMVAAIGEIGGAEKLTNAERERTNALLDKAIQKYTALGQTAPTAMRQVYEATKKNETAWGSFVDKFDVKGAITDPLGSASSAMSAFGESIGGAGIAAAATVGAIGAIGLALFHLAEQAAAVGGELNDMSEKTGVSVPALSKLSLASKVAGSDLGTMTAALFKFETNLAQGGEQFDKGLKRIGLTTEEVKAAGVDHYLDLVAEKMAATVDPTQRAAAAVELFGKQGKDIIPTLLKLNTALKDVADITPWTTEQAAAAEQFEMQMTSMKVHAEALGTSIGRDLIPPMSAFLDLVKWAKDHVGFSIFGIGTADLKNAAGYAGALTGAGQLPGVPTAPAMPTNALKLPIEAGSVEAALKELASDYGKIEAAQKKAAAAAEAWAKVLADVNSAGQDYRQTILGIDGAVVVWAEHLLKSGVSAQTVAKYYDLTDTQVKALEQDIKAETDAVKVLTEIREKWEAGTTKLNDALREVNSTELITIKQHLELAAAMKMVEQSIPPTVAGFYGQAGALESVGLKSTELHDLQVKLALQTKSLGEVFKDTFSALPSIMEQAFTGGGGAEGAAMAFGARLADDVIKAYTDRLKKAGTPLTARQSQAIEVGTAGGAAIGGATGGAAGATIGALTSSVAGTAIVAAHPAIAATVGGAIGLGAATAGIGAAAVGVYLLAKHFLTVSKAEKEARAEFQKLQDQYGSLPATIKGVGEAYALMGKSGEEAQRDLQRALDATHKSAQAEDAALRPITEILAAAEKKSNDVKAAVDQLTQVGQVFGGTVPDAFRDAVTQLAAMNGVTDEQRKALLAMTQDVKPNFEQLTQTAAKYGVTLEGLGRSFQQANIESRAKGISGDFEALTKAGGDAGGILLGMSDEISQLVNDAKRFGTAIPESMRPLIQNLTEAGKLTDDTGQALTDMAGITFEDTPIDDSMTKLADAIDKLTEALKQTANIQMPTIHVPVEYDPQNPVPGVSPADGTVPGYASGTGGFRDFGAGTLAVLHGREAVITEGQAVRSDYTVRATEAASGAARVGDIHLTFAISTLDAADFQTITERKILPAIVNQLRGGRGLTPMQDVLGIR